MDDRSRVFRLFEERDQPRVNSTTTYGMPKPEGSPLHEPFDARALFLERYPLIKAGLQRYQRKTGVLMLAFDRGNKPIAEGWIEASLDRSRVAIIGRHSGCDLVLPAFYEELPLRHAALLARATSFEDVQLRVVDLHTGVGFADESGRALQSVTSDGSLFVSLGAVRIALLVTGDPAELPEDALAAYSWIPERVFVEERSGVFEGKRKKRQRFGLGADHHPASESTMVRSQVGVISGIAKLCGDDETPIGKLTVFGLGMNPQKMVGRVALSRGILLGRYERCDVETGLISEAVSRVHLLLISEGDAILALDAGSTNGSYKNGSAFSLVELQSGDTIDLGGENELSLLWQLVA